MRDQVTTTAVAATDAPERDARQLASHLGRRAEVREDDADTRIAITGARAFQR